jgi:hypothetical protein
MASGKKTKASIAERKAEAARWEAHHAADRGLRIVEPLHAVSLDGDDLHERARASGAAPTRRQAGKYLPDGFVDLDGYLSPGRKGPYLLGRPRPPKPTTQQLLTLRTVILNLQRALDAGQAGAEPIASAAALAFEKLLGYPPGHYWRALVTDFLKADALHAEGARRFRDSAAPPADPLAVASRRLTRELLKPQPHADDVTSPAFPVGCTDIQALAWLKHRAELPAALTTAALRGMRANVSPFGGGGGRGAQVRYSAERIVAEFAAHENAPKKKRSPRKKSRKRHRAKV